MEVVTTSTAATTSITLLHLDVFEVFVNRILKTGISHHPIHTWKLHQSFLDLYVFIPTISIKDCMSSIEMFRY